MTAHKIHGNSFSQIAKMVPGRTDVRSIVRAPWLRLRLRHVRVAVACVYGTLFCTCI